MTKLSLLFCLVCFPFLYFLMSLKVKDCFGIRETGGNRKHAEDTGRGMQFLPWEGSLLAQQICIFSSIVYLRHGFIWLCTLDVLFWRIRTLHYLFYSLKLFSLDVGALQGSLVSGTCL